MRQFDKISALNPLPFDGFAEALLGTFEVALEPPESLQTSADLNELLTRWGLAKSAKATSADVAAVRNAREAVRSLFDGKRDEEERIEQLNDLLGKAPIALQFGTGSPTLELKIVTLKDATIVEQVRVASAVNLATAIMRHGFSRLRICEAVPCRDAFIDTSKKGSRRFCGGRCASRWHVSAFRTRQRNDDD
jgi:predicted RNA-binding Zn ribbon-like protein